VMSAGSSRVERAALFAVAGALLLVATHQLVALDLWWQLAAGERILAEGLPLADPYSFGHPGLRWLEHRWLFFVAEFAIFETWGLNGLILAKLVWLAGCLLLLDAAMRPGPGWARALGLLVAVSLLHSRLKVRPELATYACVIGFLWVYEAYRRHGRDRQLFLLPLIQVLWSNTHTLWIVGPALAWTAWAVEGSVARWPALAEWTRVEPALSVARRRALLRAALAVSFAALATPYVFLGELYPATILEQIGVGSRLREVIVELKSPLALRGDWVFFGSYAASLLLSFGCLLLPVRPPLFRVLVWAGFAGFTLLAARNVALLGPVAGWVVARQLGGWWEDGGRERAPRLASFAAWGVLLSSVALGSAAVTDQLWRPRGWDQRFGTGLRVDRYPIEAMAFVTEHDLPRPVLSGLADASYLIFEGGPGSVFIDGRLEVYGADRVLTNAAEWAEPAGLMADADRLGINSVLLPIPLMANAVERFEASSLWVPVYYDSARVLYVRRAPERQAKLAGLSLDWNHARPRPTRLPADLRASDWMEGWAPRAPDVEGPLGRAFLLIQRGAPDAAEASLREALERDPNERQAHLLLGLLADLAGDPQAAALHLAHVEPGVRDAPGVAGLHFALSGLRGDPSRRFDLALVALAAGEVGDRVLGAIVGGAMSPERIARARAVLEQAVPEAAPERQTRLRAALAVLAGRAVTEALKPLPPGA